MHIVEAVAAITIPWFFIFIYSHWFSTGMAGFAGLQTVFVFEFEARIYIVVERCLLPFCLSMTGIASIAKSIFMHIFDGVAGDTGFWRIFKAIIDVTTIATDFSMRITKAKICFIMVKFCIAPGFRGMAIATLAAKFVLMNIIVFMTTNTI